MLDKLMKFGAYRVDYFDSHSEKNPEAFGFYIRAELPTGQAYCREAKHQLYSGLGLIYSELGMRNLVAIYVDVDCLANLDRPAYKQMKFDMVRGLFRRVLVLNHNALFGCPSSDLDVKTLAGSIEGMELITIQEGECKRMLIEPMHLFLLQ
jgi:hypothetical protein